MNPDYEDQVVDKIVNSLIEDFGLDVLFTKIPNDWSYTDHHTPNKHDFVYYYYWEMYMDIMKSVER